MTRRSVLVVSAAAASLALPGWYWFERGALEEQSRVNIALITGVYLVLVLTVAVGMWRRPTDTAPRFVLVGAALFTIGYFRFLQPPLVAAIATVVWLASPAVVLSGLLAPAYAFTRRLTFGATVLLTAAGLVTVAVSGPSSAEDNRSALRAMSWAYFDASFEWWVRQENPLQRWSSEGVVVTSWIVWSVVVVLFAGALVRVRRIRRWWRVGVVVAVVSSILLAVPQRAASSRYVLSWPISDLVAGLPIIVVAVYAGWAVWTELITPRLARPSTLVLRLADDADTDQTLDQLRIVLGDPTAIVVFRDGDVWVDQNGRLIRTVLPDRQLVVLTRERQAFAAMDLDAATIVDPDLLQQAAASIAVSIDAQRLAALAATAAADARAAALALLRAEEEAAAALSAQISDGPDRSLLDVERRLRERPLPLGEIHDELRRVLDEVRAIAHGAVR